MDHTHDSVETLKGSLPVFKNTQEFYQLVSRVNVIHISRDIFLTRPNIKN